MSIRARRRLVWGTAVLALTCCAATACTAPTGAGSGAPAAGPVRIGVMVPLSGPRAAVGREEARGAELAAELVNGDHRGLPLPLAAGKGLPRLRGARVELKTADSWSGGADGGEQADRLVTDSDVRALVVGGVGNVGSAASRRAERLHVPLVHAGGLESYLTELGLDWYFRVAPTDRVVGEGALALLRRAALAGTPLRRVAMLYPAGGEYADLPATVADLTAGAGITVVDAVEFEPDSDLVRATRRVVRAEPDVVVALAFSTADAVTATRSLQRRGLPFIGAGPGFAAPNFASSAGAAAEGILRASSWSPDFATRNPTAAAVAAMYQRRFGTPMTVLAASTFTATLVAAAAIDTAGSVDPTAIRSALLASETGAAETIMPWVGIRFEPGGQNALGAGVVEQFVAGRFRLVHPPELATVPLTWPAAAP